MSQNIIVLYEDASRGATLSWGNWQISRDNLLDEDLGKVARTNGVALEDTRLRVALDATYYARAIVLGPGTFGPLYQYRIRLYSDDTFAVVTDDSGWIQPAASQGMAGIQWGQPGFWVHNEERGNCLIHVFDGLTPLQNVSIEIDDQDNADGYLDIGRLFMPMGWQPSLNYTKGNNGLSFGNRAGVQQSLAGNKIFRRRVNPRRFQCSFDHLPKDEAFAQAYTLIDRAGFDRPVFVIPDPDDVAHLSKRSFFGTITNAAALSQAVYARVGTGFEIEELI